jgi:hypothetical protein
MDLTITTKELFNTFIALVKSYALKTVMGLSGFRLWVAKLIINQAINLLKKIAVLAEQDVLTRERLAKYAEIITNPTTTPEERRKADNDFLSGK